MIADTEATIGLARISRLQVGAIRKLLTECSQQYHVARSPNARYQEQLSPLLPQSPPQDTPTGHRLPPKDTKKCPFLHLSFFDVLSARSRVVQLRHQNVWCAIVTSKVNVVGANSTCNVAATLEICTKYFLTWPSTTPGNPKDKPADWLNVNALPPDIGRRQLEHPAEQFLFAQQTFTAANNKGQQQASSSSSSSWSTATKKPAELRHAKNKQQQQQQQQQQQPASSTKKQPVAEPHHAKNKQQQKQQQQQPASSTKKQPAAEPHHAKNKQQQKQQQQQPASSSSSSSTKKQSIKPQLPTSPSAHRYGIRTAAGSEDDTPMAEGGAAAAGGGSKRKTPEERAEKKRTQDKGSLAPGKVLSPSDIDAKVNATRCQWAKKYQAWLNKGNGGAANQKKKDEEDRGGGASSSSSFPSSSSHSTHELNIRKRKPQDDGGEAPATSTTARTVLAAPTMMQAFTATAAAAAATTTTTTMKTTIGRSCLSPCESIRIIQQQGWTAAPAGESYHHILASAILSPQ